MTSRKRSRARRVLGVLGAVVGTTVTFVASAAAGVGLHLDVPATRRLVVAKVNDVLATQLRGEVRIEALSGLGLGGIEGARVRVKDPEGVEVLFVDGARIRVRTLRAAKSALFGKGDIDVSVPEVSLSHADIALDHDPMGALRLARAFSPKPTDKPPKPENPNARAVRIDAPDLVVRHAWVHGSPSEGAPSIDADIVELAAHAHVDSKETRAGLDRVDLVTRGLPAGVDPRGSITGKFQLDAAEDAKPNVAVTFDGVVMGARTRVAGTLHGDDVNAVVDAHAPSAASVGKALGELPLRDELTIHADAHGTLPKVAATAKVALGRATVDVDADASLDAVTAVDARVAAREVDLSRILRNGPASNLGLDAKGKVEIGDAMRAEIALDTLPGVIAGRPLPPIVVRGAMDGDSAQANVVVREPSMPTTIDVRMSPERGDRIVTAHATVNVPDLHRVPMVGDSVDRGRAQIRADARLALEAKTIAARADIAATKLSVANGAHTIADVRAKAEVAGSLDAPTVDAAVYATDLHAAGFAMNLVQARTRVTAGQEIVLSDPRVDVDRFGERLTVGARAVRLHGTSVSVDEATILGLGAPIRLEASRTPEMIAAKIDAPSIDLVKATKMAGQDLGIRAGTLAVGADVRLRRNDAEGRLEAKLDRFAMKELEGGAAELDVTIDHHDVTLGLEARLAKAGTFSLQSKRITLGGPAGDPRSWSSATGRLGLEADVDMAKLVAMLPDKTVPFGELAGELVVTGAVGRDSASAPPELRLHAHTIGLVAAGVTHDESPIAGTEVEGVAPWRSTGVDLGADIRTDATSGLTQASLRLHDRIGQVVAFDAKSIVPYSDLLARPGAMKHELVRVPIQAKLVVPRRDLRAMPEVLGTKSMTGAVEAELDVGGTAIDPRVTLVAHARGFQSPDIPTAAPADADVEVRYDGRRADVGARVLSANQEVLALLAHADARARDFIEPAHGQTPAWGGGAKVKLSSFPLDSLGPLASRQVGGRVSGEASLEGLNDDARLAAHIAFADLKVGRAEYKNARIDVDAKDNKLTAKARFEQTDGFAELEAAAGMTWGKALAPTLAEERPLDARFAAKNFRAAAIQPFIGGAVQSLDGRIDADAKAAIVPSRKEAKLDGRIELKGGKMQLAALGETLEDVRAKVTMDPSGRIKVEDVFARVVEGEIHADADVKLAGMQLERAVANVRIPEKRAIDVAVSGQPVGEIWGNVKVDASASDQGKRTVVVIDVPKLGVELPQSMKTGVQKLEEKENIRVGVYRDSEKFMRLPLDREDFKAKEIAEDKAKAEAKKAEGAVTVLDVRLGRIEVDRGNMLRAVVSGNPKITIAGEETTIDGQVKIDSGWVDVQGKKFEVDKGTVTFTGEPDADPIIDATAKWESQDGTQIFASFVGPVETGKVTLRSEPPRPQNEILATILFGSSDGANPRPPPAGRQTDGTMKTAASVGGGLAAKGLTEALDDLAGIEATARIDTTSSRNPRPEVEVQVSPKVSVAVSHIIGTPPVTEPPDKNLATIEWAFRPRWTFATTVGDRGRQLFDLVWQKRY